MEYKHIFEEVDKFNQEQARQYYELRKRHSIRVAFRMMQKEMKKATDQK